MSYQDISTLLHALCVLIAANHFVMVRPSASPPVVPIGILVRPGV